MSRVPSNDMNKSIDQGNTNVIQAQLVATPQYEASLLR